LTCGSIVYRNEKNPGIYCERGNSEETPLEHQLSEIVLFHRKESGLTRNQLADLAGVGKTVIYDIEKGRETVRFSTLKKVLKALNIKINFTSPLMGALNEKS
jgi:y4mF family transcriptional regulator